MQESSVPKKRLSFTVSESWKEAIAQVRLVRVPLVRVFTAVGPFYDVRGTSKYCSTSFFLVGTLYI